MAETLADRLVAEYRDRLDEALIITISSDFSLDEEDSARSVLTALADEATSVQQQQLQEPQAAVKGNGNARFLERTQLTQPGLSYTDDDRSTTTSTTLSTTDDEEVERAFRDWSLRESGEYTSDGEEIDILPSASLKRNDGSAATTTPTSKGYDSPVNASDPISFLKTLFPKRQRLELDLMLQDHENDVEVRAFCF